MIRRYRTEHRRAFTLVECLAAMMVLSVAVLAVVEAISVAQTHAYEALQAERALALAEALAEEIVALPYTDPEGVSAPGPESGEARLTFDNADDFHNFNEAAGNVADAQNVLYAGPYQQFSRSVTAGYTSETIAALGGTINGLAVTVTVTDSVGRSSIVTRFIPEPGS